MNEVRVGVIGVGSMGREHIGIINGTLPGARVVAVNDANCEAGMAYAKEQNVRFMENPHDLIQADDIDAVMVVSWDPTHEAFVLACLAAGKYVFCEKPLAETAAGCKRIMDAEISGGKRLLQVGFMRRYDEHYRKLKRVLDSRELGEPLRLHCQHRVKQPGGATHTSDTLITRALSHEFDVTRWLLGEELISAQVIRARSTKYAAPGLSDPQFVILRTEGNICVDLEIFMNARYGYEIQCEALCEEGSVSLPQPADTWMRCGGTVSMPVCQGWEGRFAAAYAVELREWLDSVREGRLQGPSAWDGYASSAVAEACVESARISSILPIKLGSCPDFYK